MGLFSKITKVFTAPVKKVVKAVVPKVIAKPLTNVITAVEKLQPKTVLSLATKGPVLGPIEFLAGSATPKLAPYVSAATSIASAIVPGGAAIRTGLSLGTSLVAGGSKPMAFDIGGLLKGVGSIFGGGQNDYFQTISGVANTASNFFPMPRVPTPTPLPVQPVMAAAAPAMRAAGAMVTRGFFNKFPNLALAIQQLRARGMNVKRSQLWSLLKRFGPELLVTGGLLTAAGVSELMMAGPGRRRMNPANAKALRRSMRRIESFHRLCVQADRLRAPRRRSAKSSRSGSATFVRQG